MIVGVSVGVNATEGGGCTGVLVNVGVDVGVSVGVSVGVKAIVSGG